MAKSRYIPILFLVFDADPKVPRHNRAIGADGKFAQFKLLLSAFQHAGVYETYIWDAPKFLAVIIHCFLDFNAQCGARIIVKP